MSNDIVAEMTALFKQRKYAEACELFKKSEVGGGPPWDGPLWRAYGNCLLKQALFAEAKEAYDKAIECEPENYKIYFNIGLMNAMMRNYSEAEDWYLKALSKNNIDKLPLIYLNLGYVSKKMKRYGQALIYFNKSVEMANATNCEAAFAMFEKYIIAKIQCQYNEAYKILCNALLMFHKYEETARDCKDAEFFCMFAALNQSIGQYSEACRYYRHAIMMDDQDPLPHIEIAGFYTFLRDNNIKIVDSDTADNNLAFNVEHHLAISEKLLKNKIQNSFKIDYLLSLILVNIKTNKFIEAEKNIAKLDEYTDKYFMLEQDKLYSMAYLYAKKDKYDIAAEYYKELVFTEYDNIDLRYALATSLVKCGRLEAAEADFIAIMKATEHDVDSLVGLAELYHLKGEGGDDDSLLMCMEILDRVIRERNNGMYSRNVSKKELSILMYSLGHTRYQIYKKKRQHNYLKLAIKDISESYKMDKTNNLAAHALNELNKRYQYGQITETYGPVIMIISAIIILLHTQISYFLYPEDIGKIKINSIASDTSYITLTFGSLIFILVGLTLPQLVKLKVLGFEFEKCALQEMPLETRTITSDLSYRSIKT